MSAFSAFLSLSLFFFCSWGEGISFNEIIIIVTPCLLSWIFFVYVKVFLKNILYWPYDSAALTVAAISGF